VAGLDLARESDENRARVETGPAAPDTDLFHPNPDDPYTGSLVPNGASTKGTATTVATGPVISKPRSAPCPGHKREGREHRSKKGRPPERAALNFARPRR